MTERNVVCVRLSPEVLARHKEAAEGKGLTISEYGRAIWEETIPLPQPIEDVLATYGKWFDLSRSEVIEKMLTDHVAQEVARQRAGRPMGHIYWSAEKDGLPLFGKELFGYLLPIYENLEKARAIEDEEKGQAWDWIDVAGKLSKVHEALMGMMPAVSVLATRESPEAVKLMKVLADMQENVGDLRAALPPIVLGDAQPPHQAEEGND